MGKVIIKHLSGSRSNQTESFELPIKELVFGRDPGGQVIFDPIKDDLVGRIHCKITVQNNDQFLLTDLNSRNGTFVNNQKIIDPVQIDAGDTVQLGKGGPQFVFDLDPRPKPAPKATRFGDTALEAPLTREISTGSGTLSSSPDKIEPIPASMPTSDPSRPGIGRNTVERLITQAESNTRKKMINIGSGIIGIIILISGFFSFQNIQNKAELEQRLAANTENQANKLAELKANQRLNAADIFKKYGNSTVLIEASWKLIHIPSGKQLFQQKLCVKENKRKQCAEEMPLYFYCNGVVEPSLGIDSGIPIGSSGLSGSGFVVDPKGFILTNRHVGASWHTQYRNFPLPGILLICTDETCTKTNQVELKAGASDRYVGSLNNWIPSKAKCLGKKPLSGKIVEGRNDYLEVTFPKTQLRIPAHLVRVSDTADVALIKIDVPQELETVPMSSKDDDSAGDPITVMGYPGVSPHIAVKMDSQDPLNREGEWQTIPDPTVTPGTIGKVISGTATISDSVSSVRGYYSEMGDVYQLTVNATGGGNSGGPVFNDKGNVIGIFTYGRSDQSGINITFAVPIKHGQEIMGIQKVIE